MRSYQEETKIFDAKAATGTGLAMLVSDFQHLCLTLTSASSGSFTIKFQGSHSETCPTFSSAQSATNRWDYIQVKDYQNNAAIDGDTGVAFAGTDDVRMFEFNTNGLKWVSATIPAYAAGAITLYAKPYSDN